MWAQRAHAPRVSWSLPLAAIGGGFGVAALTCILLDQASLVWPILLIAGVLAVIPTFLVRDAQTYWLVVYLFAVTLDVKKLFGDAFVMSNRLGFDSHPDPSLLVPELRLADIPFAVLMIFWLWRLSQRKQPLRWPRATWLYVAYLLWCAISLVISMHPYLGAIEMIRQLKFFLVYLYAVNNLDRRDLLRVVGATLLGLLFVQASWTLARFTLGFRDVFGSALGRVDVVDLSQHLNISEAGGGTGRAWGTVPSPRGTASFLLMLLPLPVLTAMRVRPPWMRAALLGLAGLGVAALVATFSRAGLTGLFAALPLWLLVGYRWRVFSRRTMFRFIFAALLGAVAISPFVSRFLESRPNNVKIRWAQYDTARNMILANPILGVGPGNSYLLQKGYSKFASDLPLTDPLKSAHTEPIHSTHLARIVEVGLVGFLLHLAFFAVVFATAWRHIGSRDPTLAVLSAALATGLLALFVQLAADPIFEATLHAMLLLFAGLIFAIARMDATEEAATAAASAR